MEEAKKQQEKEDLFCLYFVSSGNVREAAVRAGYPAMWAERRGMKLLHNETVREKIARLQKEQLPEGRATAGLMRLAFGPVCDAVRLLYAEDDMVVKDLDKLDLFNVSEIKKQKGGGMEIKFYDRMKALEALQNTAGGDGAMKSSFYAALEQSARDAARGGAEHAD